MSYFANKLIFVQFLVQAGCRLQELGGNPWIVARKHKLLSCNSTLFANNVLEIIDF